MKFRGIPTTQEPKHEQEPKTITNRLGHKSMSLPRIDDIKRWAGFPGLTGWAFDIAKMIPDCRIYVEAFAGAAKIYQELIKRKDKKIDSYVLNDSSEFVCKWLEREFKTPMITKQDFRDCIKTWDGENTFFLFDLPWYKEYYFQDFATFNRISVQAYSEELLNLIQDIEGKFIITSRNENTIFKNAKYKHKLITSKYVVSGHYPKCLITTNLELKKCK